MVDDRCEDGVQGVGALHAFDEVVFPEDVLGGAVGGLGDGEAVPAARGGGRRFGDETLGDSLAGETGGDAEQVEMNGFAGRREAAFAVLVLQVAEDFKDRQELGGGAGRGLRAWARRSRGKA